MKMPHLYCYVIYFVMKSCLGFEVFLMVPICFICFSIENLGLLNWQCMFYFNFCYALECWNISEAVNPDTKHIPMKL